MTDSATRLQSARRRIRWVLRGLAALGPRVVLLAAVVACEPRAKLEMTVKRGPPLPANKCLNLVPGQPKPNGCEEFMVREVSHVVVQPGQEVLLTGQNFRTAMTLASSQPGSTNGGGIRVLSDSSAALVVPSDAPYGPLALTLSQDGVSQKLHFFASGAITDHPIFTGGLERICRGEKFYDATGTLQEGTKDCGTGSGGTVLEDCTTDGQVDCRAVTAFRAVDANRLIAANIRSTVTIAGVVGTYPSLATPLASGTAMADLTTVGPSMASGAYEFFDSAGRAYAVSVSDGGGTIIPTADSQTFGQAGTLYRGFTVGGTSLGPMPCATSGQQNCLVSGSYVAATQCAAQGSNCYVPVYAQGAQPLKALSFDDIDGGKTQIRSTLTLAGVAGTLVDCTGNGAIGCVTTGTYKSADLTNLTQGNIKKGVTLAGVTGTYPSVAAPLTGSTGTADLTTFGSGTPVGVYEFFDSAGNIYSATVADAGPVIPNMGTQTVSNTSTLYRQVSVSGDANLVSPKIKSGTTIFGVAGTVLEKPADCNSDGGVGCVSTGDFKAVDMTKLIPGNVKNAVTIAGVVGSYPSAGTPLVGANGTADLPAFGSTTGGSTYEWFQSDGTRLTGSITADQTVTPGTTSTTLNTGVYRSVTVNGDANLTTENIKSGTTIFGVAGTVTPSPGNCSGNGSQSCVATGTYYAATECAADGSNCFVPTYVVSTKPLKAISYDAIESGKGSIRTSLTLSGIAGTLGDCSTDGGVGCVSTGDFKAVDMTKLIPGNVKNAVTIAGVVGSYPSAGTPLANNTNAVDLTSFGSGTPLGNYEFFDSAGTVYSATVSDSGPVTPNTGTQTVSNAAILYRQVSVNGDANLTTENIKSGTTIFGVAGTVTPSPANCSTNGSQSCVASGTYYAATECAADSSNCFVPTYVVSTKPLKAISYDAIESGKASIRTSLTLSGIAGTLGDCSTDGGVGCVSTGDFKAVDMTKLIPGNVKNAVTIAGVVGSYPSAGTPLVGANGTADLPAFGSTTGGSTYEWFQSDGTRLTGSITADQTVTPGTTSTTLNTGVYRSVTVNGDANLTTENIKSGTTIFGVAGTVTPSPGNCSGNGSQSCVATGTYYAATECAADGSNCFVPTYVVSTKPLKAISYDAIESGKGSIRTSLTLSGIAGTLGDCSTDGGMGCVSTASFKAVDMTKLIPGNVKNAVTIAGVVGSYPSAGTPLVGANGTADLPAFGSTTGGSTYEWFQSDGTRLTGSITADQTVTPGTTSTTLNTGVYRSVTVNGDANLTTENIKSGTTIFGVAGTVTPSPGNCSGNGSQSCVATGTYYAATECAADGSNCFVPTYVVSTKPLKAISYDAIESGKGSIRTSLTLSGIAGTLGDCSTDGGVGCVSTGDFKAVDMTKLIPGNVKNAVTIAGVVGSYPSAGTPLANNTNAVDLTSFGSGTPLGNYEFFDSAGTVYSATVSDSGPVTPNTGTQTVSNAAILYRQVSVNGDANLTTENIKSGTTIFGVAGTVTPSPANCSTNGSQSCVASGTYYAATECAADSSNCFVPTYVVSTKPLKAISYDAIESGKASIRTSLTLSGIAGTLGDCSTDGGVGCVSTGDFKAVDMTKLIPGNVKNAVTIAGVVGSYPSAGTPLVGANGTADLPAFGSTTGGSTYEWFQSDGTRLTGSITADQTVTPGTTSTTLNTGVYRSVTVNGDANLTTENIKSGTTIFGVAGTVTPSPGNCSGNGSQSCVATGTYYAATECAADGSNCFVPTYVVSTKPLKAISYDAIESGKGSIRTSLTLSGIAGTLGDCSTDGGMGCVSTASFKAVDMTKLIPGNVKNAVTIAGVVGSYPSVGTPLANNTNAVDLTSFGSGTPLGNYEFFDSAGTVYSATVSDSGPVTPNTGTQTVSNASILYRQVSVSGDANLVGPKIKSGTTIFGVAGTVLEKPADCNSDGGMGCVSTASFKAVDMTKLIPGNVKNAVTIAGVTGSYPSAGTPLVGADGTADLPAFGSTTGGSTYEWFQSDGTRMTGSITADQTVTPGTTSTTLNTGVYRSVTVSGDANLITGNIKSGTTIFGVAGSLSGGSACSSDGQQDCTVSGLFKAANISGVTAWDIRAGKTLAGIGGSLVFYRNMVGAFNRTSGTGASTGVDIYDTIDDYNNNNGTSPFIPQTNPWGGVIVAPGSNWTDVTGTSPSCNGSTECVLRDETTGQMWARDGATTRTWEAAITYCEGLTYRGYSDWRLPSQKELMQAYVDGIWTNKTKLSLQTNYYWASSTPSDFTTYAWNVNLSNGTTGFNTKTTSLYVLCVR